MKVKYETKMIYRNINFLETVTEIYRDRYFISKF